MKGLLISSSLTAVVVDYMSLRMYIQSSWFKPGNMSACISAVLSYICVYVYMHAYVCEEHLFFDTSSSAHKGSNAFSLLLEKECSWN